MIPPGRPMDRETLTQAIAAVDAERLHYPTDTVGDLGYNCAIDDCVKALEQLRDAAQRGEKTLNHAETKLQGITNWLIGAQRGLEGKRKDEWSNGYGEALKHALFALDTEIPAPVGGQTPTEPPQTSRSELMRHAVQRGGRPMDVAALPAPVGGQTHPQSTQGEAWEGPIRHFAGKCGKHGFVFVERLPEHPGTFYCVACGDEATVGGQTPTEQPQVWLLAAEVKRAIEAVYAEPVDCATVERCLAALAVITPVTTAATPPPGAPPAFTREAVLAKIKQFEFQGGFLETVAMLKAYALTLPTEGR